MKEMTIDSIGISTMNYRRVVFLKEKTSERYLPIWIGDPEAYAIAVKLQNLDMPRPISHDLIWSVIGSLHAYIDSVVISDVRDDTFYGKIILHVSEEKLEIDARPSDALALAIRAQAPIFAEDFILDKAGVFLERENIYTEPQETSGNTKVSDDELERLSNYADFINTLNMDDLDNKA